MCIYILLMFCALTTADSERRLAGVVEKLVSGAHETYVPEDARLNITQLASKYGYPMEQHTVETLDGHIINFHRIPQSSNTSLPVVFLMHGLLESSDSWVLLGPGKALAYVLAEQGFDVWMGNARGNKHADQHTTMTNKMTSFWQFTFEEIALFDLPVMIDYILQLTKRDALYYIGHSQGTTVGYVLCSMKPQYNSKINMMFSLAPVAWESNTKSPIVRMLSPAHSILQWFLEDLNTYTAGAVFLNKISSFLCSLMPAYCNKLIFALSGYETKVNATFLSVILGHYPTGASTLQFVHFGQLVQSGRFCRYDFGAENNEILYGVESPPDYDLSKIVVPVVLFYSSKDYLSDVEDVKKLKKHLPNVNSDHYVEDFTHIDYIYSEEAVDAIYKIIIAKILNFEDTKNINPISVPSVSMRNKFKGVSYDY